VALRRMESELNSEQRGQIIEEFEREMREHEG
jgi:hypothetical protein